MEIRYVMNVCYQSYVFFHKVNTSSYPTGIMREGDGCSFGTDKKKHRTGVNRCGTE